MPLTPAETQHINAWQAHQDGPLDLVVEVTSDDRSRQMEAFAAELAEMLKPAAPEGKCPD